MAISPGAWTIMEVPHCYYIKNRNGEIIAGTSCDAKQPMLADARVMAASLEMLRRLIEAYLDCINYKKKGWGHDLKIYIASLLRCPHTDLTRDRLEELLKELECRE